jgi:hypothetical protein
MINAIIHAFFSLRSSRMRRFLVLPAPVFWYYTCFIATYSKKTRKRRALKKREVLGEHQIGLDRVVLDAQAWGTVVNKADKNSPVHNLILGTNKNIHT